MERQAAAGAEPRRVSHRPHDTDVLAASASVLPPPWEAWRKLAILDAAETLADLRVPPGNRLEKLRGDREGQHSIRINQQWRICFSWSDAGPEDVEIVDYH